MPVKGINKTLKALQKFGDEATKQTAAITAGNAQEMALRAKSKAPVDTGFMRNQISANKITQLSYEVAANAPYSGYIEFGTGVFVDVPNEMSELAAQLRGAGIKKININPQPFLYPALVEQRKIYLKDLKDELKRLSNE